MQKGIIILQLPLIWTSHYSEICCSIKVLARYVCTCNILNYWLYSTTYFYIYLSMTLSMEFLLESLSFFLNLDLSLLAWPWFIRISTFDFLHIFSSGNAKVAHHNERNCLEVSSIKYYYHLYHLVGSSIGTSWL